MAVQKRKADRPVIVATVGDVIPPPPQSGPLLSEDVAADSIIQDPPPAKRVLSEAKLAALHKARERALEIRQQAREQSAATAQSDGQVQVAAQGPASADRTLEAIVDPGVQTELPQQPSSATTTERRKRGRPPATVNKNTGGLVSNDATKESVVNTMTDASSAAVGVVADATKTAVEPAHANDKQPAAKRNRRSTVAPVRIPPPTADTTGESTMEDDSREEGETLVKRKVDFNDIPIEIPAITRAVPIGFQRNPDGIFYFNR